MTKDYSEMTREERLAAPLKRVERPYDPKRKRYYLVMPDVRRAGHQYELVNAEDYRDKEHPDWPSTIGRGGSVHVRKLASTNAQPLVWVDSPYGLPKLPTRPVIKLLNRGPLLDVYNGYRRPFISARAKGLLQSLDPDAFDFIECDVIGRNKKVLPPYWMMAVKRVVRDFDRVHSVFRRVDKELPPDLCEKEGRINDLHDIQMMPDMPDALHAFYLLQYQGYYIFDQCIVDKWRAEKLTGFFFSPIQPASPKELKQLWLLHNWTYYYENYRHEWEDLI